MKHSELIEYKKRGEKITCLTAYDASFAKLIDSAGTDIILVGDSLGMVIDGAENTLTVTMQQMTHHTEIVAKPCQQALVIADMPFKSYENAELAVLAFNELGIPLKVIGSGAMLKSLKRIAEPNVEFLGHINDDQYRTVLASARALIFPGVEDFGIVPVEAQAAGTPVIALGQGGALETVKGFDENDIPQEDGNYTGIFFQQAAVPDLIAAIRQFEKYENIFTIQNCQINARRFSKEQFKTGFMQLVERIIST